MLKSIFDILLNIGEFFSNVGKFIAEIFKDLGYLVEFLTTTVHDIPTYLAWLPGSFVTALLACVFGCVVLRILGR